MENKLEFMWLVGLLEGEGSFTPGPPSKPNLPVISLQMTDEDVVARVAEIFGLSYHRSSRGNPRWSDTFQLALKGRSAVKWMRRMRPFMSERRKEQINKALASYSGSEFFKLGPQDAAEIKRLLDAGEKTHQEIAEAYGVSRSHISHMKRGKGWAHVKAAA